MAPPYDAEQEVNVPPVTVRESRLPRVPEMHAPFPDEYAILDIVHDVSVVVVAKEEEELPPLMLSIDALTLTDVDDVVTVTLSNANVPALW